MNIHTTWIAKAAGVSMERALEIQNFIDNNWLIERWSEATDRKIKSAVKLAISMGA